MDIMVFYFLVLIQFNFTAWLIIINTNNTNLPNFLRIEFEIVEVCILNSFNKNENEMMISSG